MYLNSDRKELSSPSHCAENKASADSTEDLVECWTVPIMEMLHTMLRKEWSMARVNNNIYCFLGADSTISGPVKLRSYYAVASYSDQKSKFAFSEGTILQLLQKDPSGEL